MRGLTYIICFFYCFEIAGQCPQNTFFDRQEQIDSFDIKYPDCTKFTTDVYITEDVVDIRPLHKIEEAEGVFFIIATFNLTTIHGLENLKRVEGNFSNLEYIGGGCRISLNHSLKNLNGLSNINWVRRIDILANDSLRTFGGAFEKGTRVIGFNIRDNKSLLDMPRLYNESDSAVDFREGSHILNNENLLSLRGLDSIDIMGTLMIEDNPRLKNLEGLGKLRFTASSASFFNIINNDSLITLDGLSGLDSLTAKSSQGWLRIKDNDRLESLSGLENLKYIERDLVIENNPSLTDMSALSNLSYLSENLDVVNNEKLESLAGIESLERGVLGNVLIKDNPNLSYCAARSICEHITDMGDYGISDNAEGCNTEIEILEICSVGVTEEDIYVMFYPNPASDYIYIDTKYTDFLRLDIIDNQGRTILSRPFVDILDISTFSSGLYHVNLHHKSGQITYELLIR